MQDALGALARQLVDLTGRPIDPIRVGARGVHQVAHIVGAVVAVAAIDLAASGLPQSTQTPDSTHPRKLAEVTLGPVRAMRMGALAGTAVAEVLGAVIAVVAVDAFTETDAHPGGTPARVLTQRTVAAVRHGGMRAAPIGRVTTHRLCRCCRRRTRRRHTTLRRHLAGTDPLPHRPYRRCHRLAR